MNIYTDLSQIPADFPRSAVAVGKFDAVHLGHQRILQQLQQIAADKGLASVVFTFENNPLSVVAPEACPEALLSPAQKLERISEQGVDATVMVPFDRELASQSADNFVQHILCDTLHVSHVLVGADFRYGHKGAGNTQTLITAGERLGFTVDVVSDVVAAPGSGRVSATMIRSALDVGDVETAAGLLGRPHSVRGEVVHGAKRGRELGFPTANLAFDSEGLVPADGVYAGWLLTEGERLPAAISVGTNPTFDDVLRRQVEAFVLDRTIDLYDRVVEIEFVARLRGMVAFDSLPALIEQMNADVSTARVTLGLTTR
ncbi:bifunctional riboflavin kinase/FAD synthetase [Lysinibacter cavernae]|uniref:Riboflavin biosynthesis protein n=1 Tax=Lysinibacter cavernae TaxID=1640652 RepID=A0A7X5R0Y4_9MICO|nr:riboflavin kinase/FMN adenylyltransferase [Lysinibacter cavernae]